MPNEPRLQQVLVLEVCVSILKFIWLDNNSVNCDRRVSRYWRHMRVLKSALCVIVWYVAKNKLTVFTSGSGMLNVCRTSGCARGVSQVCVLLSPKILQYSVVRSLLSHYNMASEGSRAAEIATVAFFDLESTNLPSQELEPRITELCLTAVPREELRSASGGKPRVVNQLQLCINPCKPIPPKVCLITGLYNDTLESQTAFNEETCHLIQGFLRHLKDPVCLVAHNGDKFDFPLLLAEFSRRHAQVDSRLLCADSLKAFIELDSNEGDLTRAEVTPSRAVVEQERGEEAEAVLNEADPGLNREDHSAEDENLVQTQEEATPLKRQSNVPCYPSPVKKTRRDAGSPPVGLLNLSRRKLDFDSSPHGDASLSKESKGHTKLIFNATDQRETAHPECSGNEDRDHLGEQFSESGEKMKNESATNSTAGELTKGDNPAEKSVKRFSLYAEKTVIYGQECPQGVDQQKDEFGNSVRAAQKTSAQTKKICPEHARFNSRKSLSDEVLLQAVECVEQGERNFADCGTQCNEDQKNEGGTTSSSAGAANSRDQNAIPQDCRNPDTISPQGKKRVSYKLEEIHKRLFGSLPQSSHTSSDDTTTLMRCAKVYSPSFLHWLDKNAVPLASCKPMY